MYYDEPDGWDLFIDIFISILVILFVIGAIFGSVILLDGCGASNGKAQAAEKKVKWPPDGVREDGNVFYVDNRLVGIISLNGLCKQHFGGEFADRYFGIGQLTTGKDETTVICTAWPG